MANQPRKAANIIVRLAQISDIPRMRDLQRRTYPGWEPSTPAMIRGQISSFP